MTRKKNTYEFAKSPRTRNNSHKRFRELESRICLKWRAIPAEDIHDILWGKELSTLRNQFFRNFWMDPELENSIRNRVAKVVISKFRKVPKKI